MRVRATPRSRRRHLFAKRKSDPARAALHSLDATRSRIMRAVHSKNTGPERQLRSLLWHLGYRYRLHCRLLPGKPDIAMRRRKKVIFVHGCFWHQHPGCRKAGIPKTHRRYWVPKLRRNRERDKEVLSSLRALGWAALVVWQCELRDPSALRRRLRSFLGSPTSPSKRSAANSTLPAGTSLLVGQSNRRRSRGWVAA